MFHCSMAFHHHQVELREMIAALRGGVGCYQRTSAWAASHRGRRVFSSGKMLSSAWKRGRSPWKTGIDLARICKNLTGWWFQRLFIVHDIWDNPSHWLSYVSRWLKPPTRWGLKWFDAECFDVQKEVHGEFYQKWGVNGNFSWTEGVMKPTIL